MKLRYERGALADLDEIFAYIAADNRSGNARSRMFNSSDETACGLPIVRSYVSKNLIEISKCAALISELYALR